MSLWADSLTVVGVACLTFGTSAQAWAWRTEFTSLGGAVAKIRQDEAKANVQVSLTILTIAWLAAQSAGVGKARRPRAGGDRRKEDSSYAWYVFMAITVAWYLWHDLFWSVFRWPAYAQRIRARGGEDAVRLGRLLRQAAVWAILAAGSTLVLVAAVLTLIRDA